MARKAKSQSCRTLLRASTTLAIYEIASRGLRQDNAGRLRLCRGLGELTAKEFQEPARARPAVGVVTPHAQQEYKQVEHFGVLQGGKAGAIGVSLLEFLKEFSELAIKRLRQRGYGRLFVVDAGPKRAVGLGQGGERRECVGIGERALSCGELQDGESQAGDYRATIVDQVGRDVHVHKGHLAGWHGLAVLGFVAVRGRQIGAVRRAINRHLALSPAADRADLLALCGAVTLGLALFADWTGHTLRLR